MSDISIFNHLEQGAADRERINGLLGRFLSDKRPKISVEDAAASTRCLDDQRAVGIEMLRLLTDGGPPVGIIFWLKLDTLSADEGLPILSNFCLETDPHRGAGEYIRLDGFRPYDAAAVAHLPAEQIYQVRTKFERDLGERRQVWNSRNHGAERLPLSYFVDWARSKGFAIDWLDWAKENGYIDPLQQESAGWAGFDPEDPCYPRFLDIALQAWRAVSVSPKSGAIRPQIASWLKTAYPNLVTAEVNNICTICNWNKAGGRPRNEG